MIGSEDFDLREFILKNYLSSDFSINYQKIESTMPELLNTQQQICEDIATSVDNNLEAYVQISSQLSSLQLTLDTLTDKFNTIQTTVHSTQDQLQQTIYQIDVIVENLKLVDSLSNAMRKLTKLIKTLDFTIEVTDYGLLDAAANIMTCKRLFFAIDSNVHCRQLCQQYEIGSKINDKYLQLQNILESEFVVAIQNESERVRVLLRCFSVLELQKKPEKLTIQFVIKPPLDAAYIQMLQNKSALLKDSSILERFITAVLDIANNNLFLANVPEFTFKQILLELVYIYLSQKDCSNLYQVAMPDLFHTNLIAILKLKETLQVESEMDKKFLEKWNLSTYFQMRQAQIVKQFESQSVTPKSLLESLQFCLSDKVFLPQLQSRFLELCLMLVNRFSKLMPQSQADPVEILNDFPDFSILPFIGQLVQKKINDVILQISNSAVNQVVNECAINLEPFNGVAAKYRMTNREAPTQASNFCGNVLRPLQQFLQRLRDNKIKEIIAIEVCSQVMSRFRAIKKQTLDACDKNDELMSKMGVKKNDQDNIKIRLQFQLDEDELVKNTNGFMN